MPTGGLVTKMLFLKKLGSATGNLKKADSSDQIAKSHPYHLQDQPEKKLRTHLKPLSSIFGATLPVDYLSTELWLSKDHPTPHFLHAFGSLPVPSYTALVTEGARLALQEFSAAAAVPSLFGVYCKVLFYCHSSHSAGYWRQHRQVHTDVCTPMPKISTTVGFALWHSPTLASCQGK